MKKVYQYMSLFSLAAALLATTGCRKNNTGVWDENKTSASYKIKGALWGNEDNRLAADKDNFIGPSEEDFIPLKDEDLQSQFADNAIPQSTITPGGEGSFIPGIEHFRMPTSQLASIFRNVLFNTDDHILRGNEALATIDTVASYLLEHPHTYVFIEGHCDERGPQAYNLSLGARRANYVRSLLVQKGVGSDQLHTISYGKERPIEAGHGANAWKINRRAQFKIFQKT